MGGVGVGCVEEGRRRGEGEGETTFFSKIGKGLNAEWNNHVLMIVRGVLHAERDQTNAPGDWKREEALGDWLRDVPERLQPSIER